MDERQKAFDAFEKTGLVSVKAGLAANTHGLWTSYAHEWVSDKEAGIRSTANMARVRAAISIIAEEYDAFVKLIPSDEHLPGSYEDWVKLRSEEDARHDARGEIVKEVVIHSEEFAQYCHAQGQEPSYLILEVLAAEKVARNP